MVLGLGQSGGWGRRARTMSLLVLLHESNSWVQNSQQGISGLCNENNAYICTQHNIAQHFPAVGLAQQLLIIITIIESIQSLRSQWSHLRVDPTRTVAG